MKEGSLAHVRLSSQHNTSSRTHLLYAYFDGMVSRWVKKNKFSSAVPLDMCREVSNSQKCSVKYDHLLRLDGVFSDLEVSAVQANSLVVALGDKI
jgi:hypothetical protein